MRRLKFILPPFVAFALQYCFPLPILKEYRHSALSTREKAETSTYIRDRFIAPRAVCAESQKVANTGIAKNAMDMLTFPTMLIDAIWEQHKWTSQAACGLAMEGISWPRGLQALRLQDADDDGTYEAHMALSSVLAPLSRQFPSLKGELTWRDCCLQA